MVNPTGLYIYCIIQEKEEGKGRNQNFDLGNIGLKNQSVYAIRHNDISAVVSKLSLHQLESNIDDVVTHQKVVETTKQKTGTTILPVRFGTVVRNQEEVTNLLSKSYREYKSKLIKLDGKDEFGIKVLKTKTFEDKVKDLVEAESQQIKSIKDNISSLSHDKPGSEYMLNLTLKDTVKNAIYKKMEELTLKIHQEFVEISEDAALLSTDNLEQLALNAAYLVNKDNLETFKSRLKKVEDEYGSMGLIFHMSGPWAPYSFLAEP